MSINEKSVDDSKSAVANDIPLTIDQSSLSGESMIDSSSIVDELFKEFISKKISKTSKSTTVKNVPKPIKADEISKLLDMEISTIQAQTKEPLPPTAKKEISNKIDDSFRISSLSQRLSTELRDYSVENRTADIPLPPQKPASDCSKKSLELASESKNNSYPASTLIYSSSTTNSQLVSSVDVTNTTNAPPSFLPSVTKTIGPSTKKMMIPKKLGCMLTTESLSLIKSNEKIDRNGRVWEDGEVPSSHSENSNKEDSDSDDDGGYPSDTGSINSDNDTWKSQGSSFKHKKKHKHKHKKKKKKKSSKEKEITSKEGEKSGGSSRDMDKSDKERDKSSKDRGKSIKEGEKSSKDREKSIKEGEKSSKDKEKAVKEREKSSKERGRSKERDRSRERDRSKERDRKDGKKEKDKDREIPNDREKDDKSEVKASDHKDREKKTPADKEDVRKDRSRERDKGSDSESLRKDSKSSDKERSDSKKKDKEKKRKRDRSRSRTPKRSRKSRSRSRSPKKSRSRKSPSPRRSRYGEWDARSYSDDPKKFHKDRSRSRSRSGSRSRSKRKRSADRKKERTPTKDTDKDLRLQIDKAKLRKIAIANALNSMKSGQPMPVQLDVATVKSGGKSVEELTDFCKRISEKEQEKHDQAVSDSSEEEPAAPSDEEEPLIHHPFKVKDINTSNIVMNIRNAKQLPVLTPSEKQAQQATLRLAFPVSSGSHHRASESEWVPVERTTAPTTSTTNKATNSVALTEIPPEPAKSIFPETTDKGVDIGSIISERLQAVRKLQANPYDVQALSSMHKAQQKASQWAQSKHLPGQFVGTTGAQIMSQQEIMGDKRHQAWVKKVVATRVISLGQPGARSIPVY